MIKANKTGPQLYSLNGCKSSILWNPCHSEGSDKWNSLPG
jgi:hypothetical protein